ncbi:MAG: hypothetical protein NZZ60_07995 [Bacteroidia bacterium]|nr:hypothetical protein [Bacteroidia bacterium]MCX7652341.1 hypothetical protein [Bacteroidia bacterium]MDW8417547.1 hypothetical protein [Bacteroidia bacterium]
MRKYLLVFSSSLLIFCHRKPDEPILARYGDRYLLRSEAIARLALPQGSDTALILRTYAIEWLRQQALADTAYQLLPQLRPQIEEQVQDYRTKLLMAYLSRALSERVMNQWTLPDSTLRRAYEQHPEAFRAIQPYYQYRWVQLPTSWSSRTELNRYLSASDSVWISWLREKKYPGGVVSQWVPRTALDSFQTFFSTPLSTLRIGSTAQVPRLQEGQPSLLVFQLTGLILPGQVLPLEIVKDQVKNLLLQQKLHAWLTSFEDSVYQRALASGAGELY